MVIEELVELLVSGRITPREYNKRATGVLAPDTVVNISIKGMKVRYKIRSRDIWAIQYTGTRESKELVDCFFDADVLDTSDIGRITIKGRVNTVFVYPTQWVIMNGISLSVENDKLFRYKYEP